MNDKRFYDKLRIEPVDEEEMYGNLLPHEMEKAERCVNLIFRKGVDSEEVKAEVDRISALIAAARAKKHNAWGQRWNPSPLHDQAEVDALDRLRKSEAKLTPRDRDAFLKRIWGISMSNDPIAEAAIAEHRASRAREEVPE